MVLYKTKALQLTPFSVACSTYYQFSGPVGGKGDRFGSQAVEDSLTLSVFVFKKTSQITTSGERFAAIHRTLTTILTHGLRPNHSPAYTHKI